MHKNQILYKISIWFDDDFFDVIQKTRSSKSEEVGVQIFISQCFFDESKPLDGIIDCSHTSSWFESDFLARQSIEFLNRPNHAKSNWQCCIDLKSKIPSDKVLTFRKLFLQILFQSRFWWNPLRPSYKSCLHCKHFASCHIHRYQELFSNEQHYHKLHAFVWLHRTISPIHASKQGSYRWQYQFQWHRLKLHKKSLSISFQVDTSPECVRSDQWSRLHD